MRVLVTGANGYIGSRLLPELLSRGHDVVATYTTSPSDSHPCRDQVTWRHLDALELPSTVAALEDVDAVAYLIHGLSQEDFRRTDREAAENMRDAVRLTGVGRLVYLSGIIPGIPREDLSEHLVSRLEVEETLGSSVASALSLRAAVVVGSGSTSFEIIRQISQRIPLLQTVPSWMQTTRVQPVAAVDAVYYLAEALERPDVVGCRDLAGPDRVTYPGLLKLYAEVVGLRRWRIPIPGIPDEIVGWLAGHLTDVDTATVESLMSSLHHDMITPDDVRGSLGDALRELTPLREAIARSIVPFGSVADGASVGADPCAPSVADPEWSRRVRGRRRR